MTLISSQFKYYQEEKQGAYQNFDPINEEWRTTEVNIFLLSSFGVGVHTTLKIIVNDIAILLSLIFFCMKVQQYCDIISFRSISNLNR